MYCCAVLRKDGAPRMVAGCYLSLFVPMRLTQAVMSSPGACSPAASDQRRWHCLGPTRAQCPKGPARRWQPQVVHAAAALLLLMHLLLNRHLPLLWMPHLPVPLLLLLLLLGAGAVVDQRQLRLQQLPQPAGNQGVSSWWVQAMLQHVHAVDCCRVPAPLTSAAASGCAIPSSARRVFRRVCTAASTAARTCSWDMPRCTFVNSSPKTSCLPRSRTCKNGAEDQQ